MDKIHPQYCPNPSHSLNVLIAGSQTSLFFVFRYIFDFCAFTLIGFVKTATFEVVSWSIFPFLMSSELIMFVM